MNPFMVIAALIGLCLGSFATTAAIRFARGEQVLKGRSACDHCAAPLNYWRTLPVLGYVQARGRCAHCRGRIDPLHLAGELCGATLVVLAFGVLSPIRAAAVVGLGLVLLASALIDARTRRLPDLLTAVAASLCALLAALASVGRLEEGALAAGLTFIVLEGLRRGFIHLRGRPGLGFGDVKLAAALALWLGAAAPWSMAAAAGLALVAMAILRPRDGRMAFGPALAAAGWSVGLLREAQIWPGLA